VEVGPGNNENKEEKGWRLRWMATRVLLDEAGAGWVARRHGMYERPREKTPAADRGLIRLIHFVYIE
jgi:hypothetical protein